LACEKQEFMEGTMRNIAIAFLAFGLAAAPAAPAAAAEVTVFGSNAINVILGELVPQFERATGHKVAMRLGVASSLRKEIESGVLFDVAILVGNFDDLVKQGRVAAGTPVALGRSGYGLAVRTGAPKPDIGSTEAFKRAILNAKSIGYTKGGGSGAYLLRLLDRLGIAEAMKPKLRPGTNMQAAVARGEVEMTMNGIVPILRSPGIELVGPLPPELQSYSVFVAGVSAASRNKESAIAFVKFLAAPDAVPVFKKHGVEPVP
jgi:molybdate transport system substrate-binding protein